MFELAFVKEHIILVVFVGREHALGKELLKVRVEIVPLLALVFFWRLHRAFKTEILHFERLLGQDLHESHIFEITVRGQNLALGHIEARAKFFDGVGLARIGAKVKTVQIHLDLLLVAIGQMLVDKQVVHERKRIHQKIA